MAIWRHSFGQPAAAALAVLMATTAGSQAQRLVQQPVAEEPPVLVIRNLEGIGPRARATTPQYRTSVPQGRTPAGEWGQITVTYDTTPDWIDELTFQYHALLMREQRGEAPVYNLFRGTVTYIDIPQGRGKESTVFLRPNTLLRYGQVIAVAVEIIKAGETLAVESREMPRSPADGREEWWRSPALAPRDGHILNRSQTPFALVNFDQYQTISP